MRTNLDLDDDLLVEAAAIAGTSTKKSTVEFALQELIRRKALLDLAEFRMDFDPEAVRPGWERSTRMVAETA